MYLFDNFIFLSTHPQLNSSSIEKLFDHVYFVSKNLYSAGCDPKSEVMLFRLSNYHYRFKQILLQSLMQDKMVLKKNIIQFWSRSGRYTRVRIPLGLRCGCSETKQKKLKVNPYTKKSTFDFMGAFKRSSYLHNRWTKKWGWEFYSKGQ